MTEQGLILVTGATGFVGKWTILELLRKGYRVRGTVRSQARAHEVSDTLVKELGQGVLDKLEIVEADLLDDKGWPEAMRGVATSPRTRASSYVLPWRAPRASSDLPTRRASSG